jgi:glycosyltransferase involved in cell wall biosynthesis
MGGSEGEWLRVLPRPKVRREVLVRVLFVVRRRPYPVRGGADLRTGALVRAVEALGHDVEIFAVAEHSTGESTGEWLRHPGGHPFDDEWQAATHDALRAALDRFDPDVTVLQSLFTRPALVEVRATRSRAVLDAHNVEGPLAAALVALEPVNPLRRLAAARTAPIEAATVAEVDAVWACSAADAAVLAGLGDTPVSVVPNAVRVPDRVAGPRAPHQILFAGSMWYAPNRQAVTTLLDVLPALRRRCAAAATLVVAGPAPPDWLRERDEPWLEVIGVRDSFAELFAGSAALAVPLQVGGGSRIKVLEAFAAGLPVVSSRKGVEGLDVVDGEHVVLAETVEEFAVALAQVIESPDLQARLAAAGRRLVVERHSDDALVPIVASALDAPAAWVHSAAPNATGDGGTGHA